MSDLQHYACKTDTGVLSLALNARLLYGLIERLDLCLVFHDLFTKRRNFVLELGNRGLQITQLTLRRLLLVCALVKFAVATEMRKIERKSSY